MTEDDLKNRYGREHSYGTVRFYLEDFRPDPEESRFLLLKVIEQSVRDYISLYNSESPGEQVLWEEARGYLFNDNYKIQWGDLEIGLEDVLTILDMDISWVRKEIKRKFKTKHGHDETGR